jgi:hypothetical protein
MRTPAALSRARSSQNHGLRPVVPHEKIITLQILTGAIARNVVSDLCGDAATWEPALKFMAAMMNAA